MLVEVCCDGRDGLGLCEAADGQDARDDRHVDAGSRRAVLEKRLKQSLSKKNCVMARVAPASNLTLEVIEIGAALLQLADVSPDRRRR